MLWMVSHSAYAQDAVSKAAEHHQRAVALYRSGSYEQALQELDAAEQLHPAPLLNYNRGLVYRKMGDAAAALVQLERYREATPGASVEERAELQRIIDALQAKLGRVQVEGAAPDAAIQVDGSVVTEMPVWLNPGPHTVAVTQGDAAPFTEPFSLRAGELRSVRPVAPPELPTPSLVAPPVAVTQAPVPRSNLPLIVGWSAAGALAVGAVVTGAVAYGETQRLDALQAEAEQDGGAIDASSRRAGTWALTCDILAGAALAAAGFSLVWTLTRSDDKPLALDIGAGHVRLRGQF